MATDATRHGRFKEDCGMALCAQIAILVDEIRPQSVLWVCLVNTEFMETATGISSKIGPYGNKGCVL